MRRVTTPYRLDVRANIDGAPLVIATGSERVLRTLVRIPGAFLSTRDHEPAAIFPLTRQSIMAADAVSEPESVSVSYRDWRGYIMRPNAAALNYVTSCAAELKRPLLPHQEESCAFTLSYPQFYNAGEQGTGKTASAWFTIRLWNSQRVLIVCPKSLSTQWVQEQKDMWGFTPWTPYILTEGPTTKRAEILSNIHFAGNRTAVIVNYEALTRLHPLLSNARFDTIVFDEAWKLKNRKAQQSRVALALASQAQHIYNASGTPTGNNVGDLWHQLRVMNERNTPDSHDDFLQRMALFNWIEIDGRLTAVPIGLAEPVELMERLDRAGWHRATKSTCLRLPPQVFERVTLNLTPVQREAYQAVVDGMGLDLSGERIALIRKQQVVGGFALRPLLEHDDDYWPEDDDNLAIAETQVLEWIGSCKFDWLCEWVSVHVAPHPTVRTIIWCKFNNEVAHITEALRAMIGHDAVAPITAATKNLNELKASFNSRDPEGIRIFVAQFKKLANGHNLQGCDNNIDYSLPWSYLEYAQSRDRSHRLGREGAVRYVTPHARRTVDDSILGALDRKENLAVSVGRPTVSDQAAVNFGF